MNGVNISNKLIKNTTKIKEILGNIPSLPGCYLMKDENEKILYIGKSKCLKSRVRSYFRKDNSLNPRISLMIRQISNIEYIITDTESEALTLESNLIKSNKPYFNILLKDDKKYPYVCFTLGDDYPRIFITRRRRNRNLKDRYFGPFVDVTTLRKTLNTVKKVFPIRQRPIPLFKDKPCLNYSIGRCPGVCQQLISSSEYKKTIESILLVFQGRTEHLKKILTRKMFTFSQKLEYEKAEDIKQQIIAIDSLLESQKVSDTNSLINRDVIAFFGDKKVLCIQLFQIRAGKLVSRLAFTADSQNEEVALILQRVIEEHYSQIEPVEIPAEILTEVDLYKHSLIQEWLTELRGQKVSITTPLRNPKLNLVKLVKRNAEYEFTHISQGLRRAHQSLEELSILLELDSLPKRIEGYDISHIQGSEAVASQVVFVEGIPAKHHYRKYKIKNDKIRIGHSDDYLSIYEVINRRFLRLSKLKQQGLKISNIRTKKTSIFDSLLIQDIPDLIMIDGGKGQLNSALKALKELDLDMDISICSLAKKREEIYLPGLSKPLDCSIDDEGLLLLRRIRDEAHRFAISFHRDRRSTSLRRSILSEIPGLGPKRIKLLLIHFKSIDVIRIASIEELSLVPGFGLEIAENIWKYFHE